MFKESSERGMGETQPIKGLLETKQDKLNQLISSQRNLEENIQKAEKDIEEHFGVTPEEHAKKLGVLTIMKRMHKEGQDTKAELMKEIDGIQSARAEDLEKRFGTSAYNKDTFDAGVMEGTNDHTLLQRIEGDELRAA